jgi:hypothetical protein
MVCFLFIASPFQIGSKSISKSARTSVIRKYEISKPGNKEKPQGLLQTTLIFTDNLKNCPPFSSALLKIPHINTKQVIWVF